MAGRLTVVSYDVPSDRRRLRLANALKDFGVRVQYSVFECNIDDGELIKLRTRLLKLIDEKEDKVRLYRFCLSCAERQEVYGQGGPTEDPEVYIL
jgi:CRISPR-associated protein Cas2